MIREHKQYTGVGVGHHN